MSIRRKQTGTHKHPKSRPKTSLEFSAGGLVVDGDRILMIQVKNLKGQVVWTFPKGKLEREENWKEAALREVEEETGWRCELIKPFGKTRYYYTRDSRTIKKTVAWFLMKPMEQVGSFDPEEIIAADWFTKEEAGQKVIYPLDKKMLKKLVAEN